jgi:para-nitrobenzyl esterase
VVAGIADGQARSSGGPPTVRTTAGLVSGETVERGVRAFKGIPYAAPPVGEQRWRPPTPVQPWQGVRQSTAFAPACSQLKVGGGRGRRYQGYSEDCLYLNIWTPTEANGHKLPVMLWYHGGGFVIGSASDDVYDGRFLAQKGVVVVTTNYRVGPVGFFAHPLLSKESERGVSGNYGMLDMIAALEWVRDNIAGFGGDPERVTIFGESAGGRCVAHLMATPAAKGLFHRGIMQSSSLYRPLSHLRKRYYGRSSAEQVGVSVAEKLGCNETEALLECLRGKAADDVIAASDVVMGSFTEGNFFEPIVDGLLLPDDPSQIFEDGKQHPVPLIAGSNADESTVFTPPGLYTTEGQVERSIKKWFPHHHREILELFTIEDVDDAWRAVVRIQGDWMFTVPILKTVRTMERTGAPAYQYFFTHIRSDDRGRQLGAYHGSEIRFAFDNLDLGRTPVTDADRKIADVMSSYWVNFATTGDPNADALPPWPRYSREEQPYLELGGVVKVGHDLRPETMAVLGAIERERRANRER